MGEDGCLQAKGKGLNETNTADTLISDLASRTLRR